MYDFLSVGNLKRFFYSFFLYEFRSAREPVQLFRVTVFN